MQKPDSLAGWLIESKADRELDRPCGRERKPIPELEESKLSGTPQSPDGS